MRLSRKKKSEIVNDNYLIRREILVMPNDIDRLRKLTCDVCEKTICDDEAIESQILPCGQFCCIECLNEAEFAADNANERPVVRGLRS